MGEDQKPTEWESVKEEFQLQNFHPEHFDMPKVWSWLNEAGDDVFKVRLKMLQNLNYVPHSEFMSALEDAANSLVDELGVNYVAVVDNSPGKSKFWALSLLGQKLRNPPAYIIYGTNLERLESDMQFLAKGDVNDFLLVDDCAYSGTQVKGGIISLATKCGSVHIPNPKVLLCIPYLTSRAIDKISEATVKYDFGVDVVPKFSRHNIVKTLYEILTPGEISTIGTVREILASETYLRTTLTYFEHRRPDKWSFAPDIADLMKPFPAKPYGEDTVHYQQELSLFKQ